MTARETCATLIEHWCADGTQMYARSVPTLGWPNKMAAERFCERYWLSDADYDRAVRPVVSQVFVSETASPPAQVFQNGYAIVARRGGCLFVRNDFETLMPLVASLGDTSIAIVQNPSSTTAALPPMRFQFQTSTSWEEMISGGCLSAILLDMPHQEYFVVGQSSDWGLYVASDYAQPLTLFGVRPTLAQRFVDAFPIDLVEETELRQRWIPPAYTHRLQSR